MLGKLFICFLVCHFINPLWAAQPLDLRNVGEFTGGKYFYSDQAQSMVPTVSEGAMLSNSMGYSSFGSPLSEGNGWPEKINNQGIFPYLLKERASDSFCAFVQRTYKTSCAVVEYTEGNVPFVIGSGGYLDGRWLGINEGVVATARHNFQGRDVTRLYVRFYNYKVSKTENPRLSQVEESYIDVPVIAAIEATNGLDAGILRLRPIPEELQHKYTKMVPPTTNGYGDGFATMPEGKYALFHFAGGHHLISVGHIYTPPIGAWINSNIGIEGGDGASGAMFLQENPGHLDAHGISIYRHVDDWGAGRRPERRAIPFARFQETARTITDRIAAPYSDDPNFVIPVALTPTSDGYEFLRWRDYTHISRRHGGAFNHPADPMYDLADPDNMSNHHIIPIDHLIWLWEYFFDGRLDEVTASAIRSSVDKEEIRCAYNQSHPVDVGLAFQGKEQQTYKDANEREIDILYAQTVTARYQQALNDRYARAQELIEGLTPGGVRDKTQFAWLWWNLFKGPNSRADDPAHDGTRDYSEKHGPLSFEYSKKELWSAVKDLDRSIKELKKVSQSSNVALILQAEGEISEFLTRLDNIWETQDKRIHPYDLNDWVLVGKTPGGQFTDKEGRENRRERKNVYRLRR
jgi:hypothetical protein